MLSRKSEVPVSPQSTQAPKRLTDSDEEVSVRMPANAAQSASAVGRIN